ncbi:hypothetical protein GQ457_10G004650 [Hibiscus cannabinus]
MSFCEKVATVGVSTDKILAYCLDWLSTSKSRRLHLESNTGEVETVQHLFCHREVVWRVWSKWLETWQIVWNFGECLSAAFFGQFGCVGMKLGFWSKCKWLDKLIYVLEFVRNMECFSLSFKDRETVSSRDAEG